MAEGEKERAELKRDERRESGGRDGMGWVTRGWARKGFSQHWGLLIKVGLVDPLMKVQARGLLSALLS